MWMMGANTKPLLAAYKIIDNHAANHQKMKFLAEMSDGKLEKIIAYNELSDVIKQQYEAELH